MSTDMKALLARVRDRAKRKDPRVYSFPEEAIGAAGENQRLRPIITALCDALELAIKQRNEWAHLESPDFVAKYLPSEDAELRARLERLGAG